MYSSPLANTGLVSSGGKNGDPQERCTSTRPIPATSTDLSRPDPSSTQAPLPPGLPLIREQLNNRNISPTATDIIMASWRSGTSKQYQTYLNRWEKYCQSKELGKFEVTVEHGIDFLATLFSAGLGYIVRSSRPAQHSHLCWCCLTT